MRIERLDFRWRVLGFGRVVHDCLESLALEQGYRVCGVCDELGLSGGYFREIFLRDVGMTPKEWMRWERMVVARRMMRWEPCHRTIAERLGFADYNSFRREFRMVHGLAPMKFREMRLEVDA